MKRKTTMAIGVVVFCFMMMASGAAWCANYTAIPPNGTLTDGSTGLFWLQNANCFGAKNWQDAMSAAASLKSGSCGLTDGSTAGQWRLPTRDELKARQWNKQEFTNVQAGWYWSGTEDVRSSAWVVKVNVGGRVSSLNKLGDGYVWPVRGGQ